jgi:UDP-N-acetylmuramate dehydrogenase
MIVRENVLLAPLTTLAVGGPAHYFVEATTEAEVREALEFAQAGGLPLFVMGGGSNLLVSDGGFDGLVLRVSLGGVERKLNGSDVTYQVAAGEDWDSFVARAVEDECAGIECLSGIPGTVGATPVQNVGAYGQEVSGTIREVAALDRQSRELRLFNNADCRFGYRTSVFNSVERDRYIILRVIFALRRGQRPTIRYADLQKTFADVIGEPSLKQVREAVRAIRYSKGMLLVAGDEDVHSAGSFFKNPVVSQNELERLGRHKESGGLVMPSYPAGEGWHKLSAAWLVEQAGFYKGYARGAAGISTKHALAIVNRGGATAAEIVALADEIQARVSAQFGIELVPEPAFVGS